MPHSSVLSERVKKALSSYNSGQPYVFTPNQTQPQYETPRNSNLGGGRGDVMENVFALPNANINFGQYKTRIRQTNRTAGQIALDNEIERGREAREASMLAIEDQLREHRLRKQIEKERATPRVYGSNFSAEPVLVANNSEQGKSQLLLNSYVIPNPNEYTRSGSVETIDKGRYEIELNPTTGQWEMNQWESSNPSFIPPFFKGKKPIYIKVPGSDPFNMIYWTFPDDNRYHKYEREYQREMDEREYNFRKARMEYPEDEFEEKGDSDYVGSGRKKRKISHVVLVDTGIPKRFKFY